MFTRCDGDPTHLTAPRDHQKWARPLASYHREEIEPVLRKGNMASASMSVGVGVDNDNKRLRVAARVPTQRKAMELLSEVLRLSQVVS
jgi:hypothetical protein